ncbi:MAG: spheroidene monooxygenase [Agriterribacter sp.]
MKPDKPLVVALTIIRYPKKYVFFALLAMALHRLPLITNRSIYFWKLLGCGKGGGFSKKPDWLQWGILVVRDDAHLPDTHSTLLKNWYGSFITSWYKWFECKTHTILMQPSSGHGTWDGKEAFGNLRDKTTHTGQIAVLTRATISIKKIRRFWAHVPGTSAALKNAQGLAFSVSIGEVPFIKQATFSIWNNVEAMISFAYSMQQHTDVIQKTRKEKWYSEEMFVRFEIIKEFGPD